MKTKPVTIICTTFNEQLTIRQLLHSLVQQTLHPSEIIICDAESTDLTQSYIQKFSHEHPTAHIKLLSKKGNRSVGRNAAINASSTTLIAVTDAGCIPQKDWLEQLVAVYTEFQVPVVAGYYKGLPSTPFEEAVVPYVLVMPDKVNPHSFLPATRSILFEKKVWQDVGGFDETLSLNEDYPFAKKIVLKKYPIVFAKDAVVGWIPRKNITEFITMIAKFAQGDIEAGIVRPKVLLLFIRYLLLLVMIILMSSVNSFNEILAFLLVLFVLYAGWAVQKNIKYTPRGWYWLPILQYSADFAIMYGSLKGLNKFYNKL